MSIRIYQPERKDLLINTDWGIPQDKLTEDAAIARSLELFHGRWVSSQELQQLKDEAHAYRAIRVLAGLLLFSAVLSIFWTVSAMSYYGASGLLVLVPGTACLVAGIGLLRYARWARNVAAALFGLMLTLPFAPVGSDDKGGPIFLVIGALGLYYLFRSTAGMIFKGGIGQGQA